MDVATLYEQCDDGDAGSEWAAAVKEEMELGFETLAAEPSTIQKKPADLSSSAIANLDCLLDKASIFSKFLHERIHESLLRNSGEVGCVGRSVSVIESLLLPNKSQSPVAAGAEARIVPSSPTLGAKS